MPQRLPCSWGAEQGGEREDIPGRSGPDLVDPRQDPTLTRSRSAGVTVITLAKPVCCRT